MTAQLFNKVFVQFLILLFFQNMFSQEEMFSESIIGIKRFECKNKDVKILNYLIETNRKSINLDVEMKNNKIQIVLLNDEIFDENDGFQISIIFTSESSSNEDWTVYGRIVNAKEIINISNIGVFKRLGKSLVFTLKWIIIGLIPTIIISIIGIYYNFYWLLCAIFFISYFSLIFFISERKKHIKPKWN